MARGFLADGPPLIVRSPDQPTAQLGSINIHLAGLFPTLQGRNTCACDMGYWGGGVCFGSTDLGFPESDSRMLLLDLSLTKGQEDSILMKGGGRGFWSCWRLCNMDQDCA